MSELKLERISHPDAAGTSIELAASGAVSFSNDIAFNTDTFFVDTANGRVGIGTTSPSYPLHIISSSGANVRVQTTSTSSQATLYAQNPSGDGGIGGVVIYGSTQSSYGSLGSGEVAYYANKPITIMSDQASTGIIKFATGGNTERMRIDSSGNLLAGKTSTGTATVGSEIRPIGLIANTRDGGTPTVINRLTSDGDIIEFQKDNTPVGSIGVDGGDNLYLTGESGNTGGIYMNDAAVSPAYQGAERDNYYNLGKAPARWKDLYLSGGVYVGGTGAANYLDDYEEGTWTPYFTGATSATYATQLGRYTKIGDVVNFYARLGVSAMSWYLSSDLKVGGLPFTSSNVPYLNSTTAVFPLSGVNTMGDGGVATNVSTNSTEILFYYVNQSSGDNYVTMNNSYFNVNNLSLIITGSYKTDA